MLMDAASPFRAVLNHVPDEFDLRTFVKVANSGDGAPHNARPFQFAFDCDGVTYIAQLNDREGEARLSMRALIGILPYSTESVARRRAILEALRAIGIKEETRLLVDPRQRIRLDVELPLDGSPTPSLLIATVALFIARLRDHIGQMSTLSLPEKADKSA